MIYEMLTGERLFQGDDAVQVLSRVLEQKLDLDRVTTRFRRLVVRCLDRNPKGRLRDIGEARFWLDTLGGAPSGEPAASPPQKRWLPWAAAGISVSALIALATIHFRERLPDPSKPVRFQLAPEKPTARFAQPIGAAILYPMLALCGLFVPLPSLPPALQAAARILPLTYAVSLLQGIWKGEAWSAHIGDVVALVAVFAICTVLSARIFRWE